MIQTHRPRRSKRGVISLSMMLVVGLVGSCTSGAPESRDETPKTTDSEVLAADPRFSGQPVTKSSAEETCAKIAAELDDTGSFSTSVSEKFDADADIPCTLDGLSGANEQISAWAGVEFHRLDKAALSLAADLLREDKSHIVDCVMYRQSPPSFGLSTVMLDSGPICDTPPDMGGTTTYAESGFVASGTLIVVNVRTNRNLNKPDEYTVLGDPVPVRDQIVESTREVLDSKPKKLELPSERPAVNAIQDFCTSVLKDTVADTSTRSTEPDVVEIWPNEHASKNVWCRSDGVEGTDNAEVWTWVSVSVDVGSSDLEEFYNEANPEFYEAASYICHLLQNTETHAALSPSTVGESEAYSACTSKSDTGPDPSTYEERVVFIDNGLVVQAGSVGFKRNDAGEVTYSGAEVTEVTHDVQQTLINFLGEGYTKLRA